MSKFIGRRLDVLAHQCVMLLVWPQKAVFSHNLYSLLRLIQIK